MTKFDIIYRTIWSFQPNEEFVLLLHDNYCQRLLHPVTVAMFYITLKQMYLLTRPFFSISKREVCMINDDRDKQPPSSIERDDTLAIITREGGQR